MPAVCAGTVAALPPADALTMKPAVLKVVLQLLAALQPVPLGQHWRALLAGVCSFDRVTLTLLPLVAAGWLNVVVATPLALKLTLVAPNVPAEVARLEVWPFTVVAAFVHGLELSAQAVTVTVLDRHARLAVGSESW